MRPQSRSHIRLIRNRIFADAEVIACTCSSALSRELLAEGGLKYDALIIDEAGQATEVTTLVPLVHHAFDRLILVGDPKQLPPSTLTFV